MPMPKISVIIKAYNEQENIARAIESCLAAVRPYAGEVVVADSGSTDRTVEIALGFPVVVAQLNDPRERCCGISPQLGYQHSTGEYVYILDGDMTLDDAFLATALGWFQSDPGIAGVGGFVREMRINNIDFQSRLKRQLRRSVKHGSRMDCLNGGGLYRRSAIDDVGYLSDRNLHSYEEFDLGVRLRAKGWTLVRLEDHAADHYGYATSTYRLLWHRAKSKYVFGGGELLRAAIAGRYLTTALTKLPGVRPAIAVWVYWALAVLAAALAPTGLWALAIVILAVVFPVAVMAARNGGSLEVGFHSVATWHLGAYGLAMGLLGKRKDPAARIDSRVLTRAQSTAAGPAVVNAVS
jgi:glycosyltransferase involved in cell wall biosynthesis